MQVLVPEFTGDSVNDLSVAFTMTQVFLDDLRALGIEPVPPEALATRSGEVVTNCADNPSCPGSLLRDWPEVPMVVVASLGTKGDRLDLRVTFYGAGNDKPISEMTELIQPGQEFDFTAGVAGQANEVLELLYLERPDGPPATWTLPGQASPPDGPPDDPVRNPVVVVTPVDPPPDGPPDDPVVVLPPDDPPPDGPTPDPESPGLTGDPTGSSGRASGRVLGSDHIAPVTWPTNPAGMKNHAKEMGISMWAYRKFRASGETDPEQWLRDKRVRSRQLGVELYGGGTSGALDQLLDYRYLHAYKDGAYEFVPDDERYTQMLTTGEGLRPTVGMGLSVNLNSHVELGFTGAFFETEQCLIRSFNLNSDAHDLTSTKLLNGGEPVCVEGIDLSGGKSQVVMAGVVQPRMRIYPYGLGPVKPYLLGGLSILLLPGYEMGAQPDTRPDHEGEDAWSWGNQQGLIPVGFTGGGGLMADVLYRIGIFAELQYTWFPLTSTTFETELAPGVADDDGHLGLPDWAALQSGSEITRYEPPGVLNSMVISGGIQLRF